MDTETIKNDIMTICLDCLSAKDKMVSSDKTFFSCYIGGGRQYNSFGRKFYIRTIYLGSDSKRYTDIPEEVIDLNEVYFIYKRESSLLNWEDNYFNPVFRDAVNGLAMAGSFLVIDYKGVITEDYKGLTYKDFIDSRDTVIPGNHPNIRFVKLIGK